MSQSLNSCRTSKRGIADKPQCPSNSFRLQILIAFTIESGKSSAYFIRRAFIFLLEQILFYKYLMLGKYLKVCPPGKSHEGVCAKHSLPPFPFPVLQKYASHRPRSPIHFGSLNIVECTGSKQGECATNKNTKALASGNVEE